MSAFTRRELLDLVMGAATITSAGVQATAPAGTPMGARHTRPFWQLKQQMPEIVDWFPATRSVGTTYVSIDKARPDQGLERARRIRTSRSCRGLPVPLRGDSE